MRGLGMALLTGATAVVVWKIFAALFVGLLAMALKVALVVGVVYLILNLLKKKDDDEEMVEAEE